MEIITYDLKGFFERIDSRPFTGLKTLGDTPKVKCRGKSLSDNCFGLKSMIGPSREEYYNNIKKYGLTPEKEYIATKIKGYGDVFDICIKENDNGKEAWYMSGMFELVE